MFSPQEAGKESFSFFLCRAECFEGEPIPCHYLENVQIGTGNNKGHGPLSLELMKPVYLNLIPGQSDAER